MAKIGYYSRLNNPRIELVSLLSDKKWLILSLAIVSAVLALPQQTIELYRVIYANETLSEYLILGIGVTLLSFAS